MPSCLLISLPHAQLFVHALNSYRKWRYRTIPAEFYKAASSYILFPLSVIFNVSMQTEKLPDVQYRSVPRIFKKDTPSHPADYRPISLPCIAFTLLEAGVKCNLLNHLLENNVININLTNAL